MLDISDDEMYLMMNIVLLWFSMMHPRIISSFCLQLGSRSYMNMCWLMADITDVCTLPQLTLFHA